MQLTTTITPCLWFDNEAEQAVRFYTSIFKNSKIVIISHYLDAGREVHGRPPGSVMVVAFELAGQSFTALNGGPAFKFTEAISFQVNCDTQEEIDYFWNKLSEGGSEVECGWVKDKFGLSWQIIPADIVDLFADPDPKKAGQVMLAMLKMKKLDIGELRRAAAG